MMTDKRTAQRRGFSLIEVLIAVLVLAIGMLGLGAVFPAIIAEQRDAFAAIEGENAAASAAALLNNPEIIDLRLLDESFGKRTSADNELYLYDWIVPPLGREFYGWSTSVPGYYEDFNSLESRDLVGSKSGTWSYNANNAPEASTLSSMNPRLTELPVHARLFPQANSGEEPRYVWDIALRREPRSNRLQAAIFVRRVDARVRVPRDYTLSEVLRGDSGSGSTVDENFVRLPVALNLANEGRPAADDGSDSRVYANIQMLEVEVYEDHLGWLVFTPGMFDNTSINLATRPGQSLVDNTGVIRTVIGIVNPGADANIPDPSGKVIVAVDPPFQFSNAGGSNTDDVRPDQNTTLGNGLENERSKRASWVRQVIFTPREPVADKIVTIGGES